MTSKHKHLAIVGMGHFRRLIIACHHLWAAHYCTIRFRMLYCKGCASHQFRLTKTKETVASACYQLSASGCVLNCTTVSLSCQTPRTRQWFNETWQPACHRQHRGDDAKANSTSLVWANMLSSLLIELQLYNGTRAPSEKAETVGKQYVPRFKSLIVGTSLECFTLHIGITKLVVEWDEIESTGFDSVWLCRAFKVEHANSSMFYVHLFSYDAIRQPLRDLRSSCKAVRCFPFFPGEIQPSSMVYLLVCRNENVSTFGCRMASNQKIPRLPLHTPYPKISKRQKTIMNKHQEAMDIDGHWIFDPAHQTLQAATFPVTGSIPSWRRNSKMCGSGRWIS